MDPFLDSILLRTLTFQRTPLYKDWQHVIGSEKLDTFGEPPVARSEGGITRFSARVFSRLRKKSRSVLISRA